MKTMNLFFGLLSTIFAHYILASEKKITQFEKAVLQYQKKGDFGYFAEFIDKGIKNNTLDFAETDASGNNLFHWAIYTEANPETITSCCLFKLLTYVQTGQINSKPLLNAKNSFNLTPLHIAALTGQRRNIRELLNAGAEINALGSEHMNCLEILFNECNKSLFNTLEMIIFLYSKGAKVRLQFAELAYYFMRAAFNQLDPEIPIFGNILENIEEAKEIKKDRLDGINFVSLLIERENRQSYLHVLPEAVFAMAFGYAYNFYTNRRLYGFNPYNSANKI